MLAKRHFCNWCEKWKTIKQIYIDRDDRENHCKVCRKKVIKINPDGCKSVTICNLKIKRCRQCRYYDNEAVSLALHKAEYEAKRGKHPIVYCSMTPAERQLMVFKRRGLCDCCQTYHNGLKIYYRDNQAVCVICNKCKRLVSAYFNDNEIFQKIRDFVNSLPIK